MKTFGFIGLGLIGGSIARAIREKHPDSVIVAYDVSSETLQLAKESSVANITTTEINASFSSCDYVFLCAPVQKNDDNLKILKQYISSGCILTDVGSVKSPIHSIVRELQLEKQFIGGHPMAGSERVGFINSKAMLLENAYYILTPTASVSAEKIKEYEELVHSIGALPLIMAPEKHDQITAAVSHLPHIIAASLVNLVHDKDDENGLMKMIAAGGFKDITRIASSSATMWEQICMTNTDNISDLLGFYIDSLQLIKGQLDSREGSSIYQLFDEARIYRDSFASSSSGPIKRAYRIHVDIADEPGALAAIATILALNAISIKNMGISHNREYEGGILRIELYEEADIEKAMNILLAKGYTIYNRN